MKNSRDNFIYAERVHPSKGVPLTISAGMMIQTTLRKLWPATLLFILLSCGNSSQKQSIPRGPEVLPTLSPVGPSVSSRNAQNSGSAKDSSGSKENVPTPSYENLPTPSYGAQGASTSATSTTVVRPGQPNTSLLPIIPEAPTTIAPLYIPFKCSVVARDYPGSTPQGGQALEVLVQTEGPTSGGVWAEATSRNFRKRVTFKLEADGTGRTVLVAPDGYDVQIKIYAAPTFEPLSLMCSTST